MKSKFNHKRIVLQDGQDLTIKVYGGCINEERFSFKEINDFVRFRHILKDVIPKAINYHLDKHKSYTLQEMIDEDRDALQITTNRKSYRSSESQYRNGYVHGYSEAIDHMRIKPLKSVLKYFNGKLRSWRYSGRDELKMPPSISNKEG